MGIHYGKADFINYGKPSLLLDFARNKSLVDRISGNNLITFERASIGTYVDENGLIKTAAADEARFDHNPETGESLGLLIEEQRTNLYTQSSDMYNSYWGPVNLIRTPNATIAPDGTNTATLLVANTTNGTHTIKPNIAISTSFNTVSVFLKSNGDQYFMIRGDNQSNFCVFDLINGVIASSSTLNSTTASIMEYPNGWYKCIVSYIPAGVGNDPEFYLANSSTYNTASFSGTGANGVYIWGAQLEAGAFPTSYIPTSGSTFTRQPDIAQITGTNFTDFYNQNEGSFIATFKFESLGVFSYNDAIGLSPLGAGFMADSGPLGLVTDIWGGGTRYSGGPDPSSQFVKVARAVNFSNNDSVILSSGGNAVAQSSITQTLATGIQFGRRGGGGAYNNRNLKIKQLIYYPERLTNAQLQNLTK